MSDYSYLLVGGDLRSQYLLENFKKHNKSVEEIFLNTECGIQAAQNKIDGADVIIFPVPTTIERGLLYAPKMSRKISLGPLINAVRPNAVVFTGGKNDAFSRCKAQRVINLTEDEQTALKNAVATSEAAISLIISNTPKTIFGESIMILGYGRIGKVLARLLTAMQAEVTVCVRNPIAVTMAEIDGCKAITFATLKDLLTESRIIINTIPSSVLTENELRYISNDAYVLDLASQPGGVDFKSCKELGINFDHALSLPGKFSPLSAAEYIYAAIERHLT